MSKGKNILRPEDERFIETFGAYGMRAGMPLSVARVFAFLLVCRPVHQTAKAIQSELHLSAGSVSIATNMLTQMGLINKVTIAKNPTVHYTVEPHNFKKVIEQRVRAHAEAEQIAADALRIGGANPRLEAMRHVYGQAAVELQALLDKLDLSESRQ